MFSVATPAGSTALTTLAAVKRELKIDKRGDDAWLLAQIDSASATICKYLGIEQADDGTRTLGRETIVETIDRRSRQTWSAGLAGAVPPGRDADTIVVLARRPVVAIASITENGTAVDAADYLLAAAPGVVRRLSSALPAAWPRALIGVTYTAGWLLPGDEGSNLPADIEEAAIITVKAAWFGRTRDPAVKSENIQGVRQVDYFFGVPGQDGPLPDDALKKLQFDRNIHI